MVVAGRCYERSTRSFRPDARRLARGLRAPSAHGSRLLRTAPVSERRCNPRGPSLHAHNVGSPDAHDVIKGGAAPIGGRRPFPVSMMVRALVGRASRQLALGTMHVAIGEVVAHKGLRIWLLSGREPGPLAAMARTMPAEHCSDPHRSRAGLAPLTSRRSVRGPLMDDLSDHRFS